MLIFAEWVGEVRTALRAGMPVLHAMCEVYLFMRQGANGLKFFILWFYLLKSFFTITAKTLSIYTD